MCMAISTNTSVSDHRMLLRRWCNVVGPGGFSTINIWTATTKGRRVQVCVCICTLWSSCISILTMIRPKSIALLCLGYKEPVCFLSPSFARVRIGKDNTFALAFEGVHLWHRSVVRTLFPLMSLARYRKTSCVHN